MVSVRQRSAPTCRFLLLSTFRFLSVVFCCSVSIPSRAQDGGSADAFYHGRQLTIISGSAVGGGYDAYARLVGRHLPKFMPANVRFVIQVMPGGGSLIATNTLYNISPRDGSVLGFVQRGVLTAPLLDPKAMNYHYDARRFNWLLSLNAEAGLIIVRNSAPHTSVADLFTTELTISSAGGATEIFPHLLRNLFGMKVRIVSGYKGAAEAYLALERGEVQGRISTGFDKAVLTPWIADKTVRLLMSISLKKHPYFPDLPLVTEQIRTESDREVVELLLAEQLAGRPILMPPEVPKDRVALMREAMEKMVRDKSFLAEAEKLNLDIDPVGGAEIAALLDKVYRTPPETVARTRDIISVRN